VAPTSTPPQYSSAQLASPGSAGSATPRGPVSPSPSLDTLREEWARQVWAGSRVPGDYYGNGNGSVNGIDLASDADRRLLFAHQVREGTRDPGTLVQLPPPVVSPLPAWPNGQRGSQRRRARGQSHDKAAAAELAPAKSAAAMSVSKQDGDGGPRTRGGSRGAHSGRGEDSAACTHRGAVTTPA
jgi:hypothetical protein